MPLYDHPSAFATGVAPFRLPPWVFEPPGAIAVVADAALPNTGVPPAGGAVGVPPGGIGPIPCAASWACCAAVSPLMIVVVEVEPLIITCAFDCVMLNIYGGNYPGIPLFVLFDVLPKRMLN